MRFSAPRSTSPSPERIQLDGPSMSKRKSPILSSLSLGRPQSQRRSQLRRSSTYGIHSDSESDGSEKEPTIITVDFSDAAESQSEVDLTNAFKYVSISPTRYVSFLLACILVFHASILTQIIRNPLRPRPNPLEARQVKETIAAIRLHAKHHDPYEDWEKQTRRDAFVRSPRLPFYTYSSNFTSAQHVKLNHLPYIPCTRTNQPANLIP